MAKCKTDFRGCCCNVDGECTYWGIGCCDLFHY